MRSLQWTGGPGSLVEVLDEHGFGRRGEEGCCEGGQNHDVEVNAGPNEERGGESEKNEGGGGEREG